MDMFSCTAATFQTLGSHPAARNLNEPMGRKSKQKLVSLSLFPLCVKRANWENGRSNFPKVRPDRVVVPGTSGERPSLAPDLSGRFFQAQRNSTRVSSIGEGADFFPH
jgi:hypothetical protein